MTKELNILIYSMVTQNKAMIL